MMAKQLDQDLIDHACAQLGKAARKHVRAGMAPASAASAAIRETKALFPIDWRLGVQGDDTEDEVEVWEVEHKRSIPCARITRETEPSLTAAQQLALDRLALVGPVRRVKFDFRDSENRRVTGLHAPTIRELARLGLLEVTSERHVFPAHGRGRLRQPAFETTVPVYRVKPR